MRYIILLLCTRTERVGYVQVRALYVPYGTIAKKFCTVPYRIIVVVASRRACAHSLEVWFGLVMLFFSSRIVASCVCSRYGTVRYVPSSRGSSLAHRVRSLSSVRSGRWHGGWHGRTLPYPTLPYRTLPYDTTDSNGVVRLD